MKTQRPKRDLVEIFGYAPDDMSTACRSLWTLGACPFTEAPCVKTNHDKPSSMESVALRRNTAIASLVQIVFMRREKRFSSELLKTLSVPLLFIPIKSLFGDATLQNHALSLWELTLGARCAFHASARWIGF